MYLKNFAWLGPALERRHISSRSASPALKFASEEKSESILSKPGFAEKAPKERVEQERANLEKLKGMLSKLV